MQYLCEVHCCHVHSLILTLRESGYGSLPRGSLLFVQKACGTDITLKSGFCRLTSTLVYLQLHCNLLVPQGKPNLIATQLSCVVVTCTTEKMVLGI